MRLKKDSRDFILPDRMKKKIASKFCSFLLMNSQALVGKMSF